MTLLIGHQLGRYTIESRIGDGPLMSSYRAVDTNLDRHVTVQVAHPRFTQETAFHDAFTRIARAAVRVDHPGLVRIFDFDRRDTHCYVITEFVDGPTLARLLNDMRASGRWLPLAEAIPLVQQIGAAMEKAHAQKLNYVVATPTTIKFKFDSYLPTESGQHPVVTDLGLFHQSLSEMNQSPDPLESKRLTASAVHSLGLLLYEVITGQMFDTLPSGSQMEMALNELPLLHPHLPQSVVLLLKRALHANHQEPFDSVHAFLQALTLPKSKAHASIISLADQYAQSLQHPLPVPDLAPMDTIQQTALPDIPADPPRPEPPAPAKPSPPASRHEENLTTVLQIETPDGATRTVEIPPQGISVGRSQDNDLTLDDPRASRRHARIDFDGTHYSITDHGSLNGTFASEIRLAAQRPRLWKAEETIRIGGHRLRLLGQFIPGQASGTGPFEKQQPTPPPTLLIRETGDRVAREEIITHPDRDDLGLYRLTNHHQIEPGQSSEVSIVLLNLGASAETMTISVDGVPPPWLQLPVDQLVLQPGDQETVNIGVAPPRLPLTRAARYRLAVKVASQSQMQDPIVAYTVLTITPYFDMQWEITPAEGVVGEPMQVTIQNNGNAAGRFLLQWWDLSNELTFEPETAELTIQAGTTGVAEFRAMVRNRRWIGGAKRHIIQVQVAPEAGSVELREHVLINRSRIGLG
jgi:serine/threonine protein kinase